MQFGLGTVALCLSMALGAMAQDAQSTCSDTGPGVYQFSLTTIDGSSTFSLGDFAGKALVIANVASFCGLTSSQMPGLNDLKNAFDPTEIEIIGNPCNNFGLQEPGMNSEIPNAFQYVRPGGGYVPNFILTEKIQVNGVSEIPLYTYLKDYCPPTKERIADTDGLYYTPVRISDITWNFEKFLVFGNGSVYKRYEPSFPPLDMVTDVQFVLSQLPAEKEQKAQEEKAAEPKNRPMHRFHQNMRG